MFKFFGEVIHFLTFVKKLFCIVRLYFFLCLMFNLSFLFCKLMLTFFFYYYSVVLKIFSDQLRILIFTRVTFSLFVPFIVFFDLNFCDFSFFSAFFDFLFLKFFFPDFFLDFFCYILFNVLIYYGLFFVNLTIFFDFCFVGFFCSFFFFFTFVFIYFFFLVVYLFLLIFNFLFSLSFFSFFNFSKDFFVIEEEDLWVSANLFYFDQRIADSENLKTSTSVRDVEIFLTLLDLFFKFPNSVFDNDYVMFSKAFQHAIFGNNITLYNFKESIIEPYNKSFIFDKYNNAVNVPSFNSLSEPFVQLEFYKSDFFFFRKMFKYLFLYKGKNISVLKRRRRMYRKLFKRRNSFLKDFNIADFRSFYGLSINSDKIYSKSSNFLHTETKSLYNFSPNLRDFINKYTAFQRKSRMESRFLKFFWISLPFYFLPIQSFFYNLFPRIKFRFFFSKIQIWIDKFFNLFLFGHRQLLLINFPLAGVSLESLKTLVPRLYAKISSNFKMSDQLEDFIRFSDSEKDEKKKGAKIAERTSFISTFVEPRSVNFIFDVINVNQRGVLDDLRRIKKLKTKPLPLENLDQEENISNKFKATRFSFNKKKIKKNMKRAKDRFIRKKRSSLIYEDLKNFWIRTESDVNKNLRFKRSFASVKEGNSSILFLSKKRVRYKRYLRRPFLKKRSFWIGRNRFFFPTLYNSSKYNSSLKISVLDLFKLLEYFYFILGNDRDIFDNAIYSILVSNLKERFGEAIVSDLLSTKDHQQATKVSVIMHVQDKDFNSPTAIFSNATGTSTSSDELEYSKFDAVADTFQLQNFKIFASSSSNIFLSPAMYLYLSNLLFYYKKVSMGKSL